MLKFDTPLRRRARKFSAPNSAAFDASQWSAIAQDPDATSDDLELGILAMWLHIQSTTLRDHFARKPLPALAPKLAITLAIAMLNRETSVVAQKFAKAQKTALADGALSIDHLANVGIGRSDGYFETDAASVTDAATDATDSWLYDISGSHGGAATASDLATIAMRCIQQFSIQRSHYEIWQQALWAGWTLSADGEGHFHFGPPDRAHAALLDGCLLRKQSNFMEFAWIDIASWPAMTPERRREFQLPLTVTAVDRKPGRTRRFVVARPSASARTVPAFVVGRAGLEGSYLAVFLDRELPKARGLTCALLLRAWYVLLDLAETLAAARPRATFHSIENLRQWALVCRHGEVLDVLRRALAIDDKIAEAIVAFFTWEKGTYKGLWGAPLVPLPNSDDVAIALNVLATSNVVRRAEIWLTKGGLDDNLAKDKRGDTYEAALRGEIGEAVARNDIVRNAVCAPHAIKRSKDVAEQIDLVVQFSSLLLVGEVKCLLFPADHRERYNFLQTLHGAADQARRKAALLAARRDIAAKALDIDEAKAAALTVVPLVVTNQGFGMSLVIDDCVVTDAKFLKLYLGSGKYIGEAAVNRLDGRMAMAENHLYRSETEAAARLVATLHRPPSLYRFVDRLAWSEFAFPTYDGTPLLIAQTELPDVSGEIRMRYESLGAAVDPSARCPVPELR
jgi:hypothetical protein